MMYNIDVRMNWCINVVYRVFIKKADGFNSIRLITLTLQNRNTLLLGYKPSVYPL